MGYPDQRNAAPQQQHAPRQQYHSQPPSSYPANNHQQIPIISFMNYPVPSYGGPQYVRVQVPQQNMPIAGFGNGAFIGQPQCYLEQTPSGPCLPQPEEWKPPSPRKKTPLVLLDPETKMPVDLPAQPSKPSSRNPTPNTTQDSEVICEKKPGKAPRDQRHANEVLEEMKKKFAAFGTPPEPEKLVEQIEDITKPEKIEKEPVEAPVETSGTSEVEAVTDTLTDSTPADGGPSLFDAPEGFGADEEAASQEDLTADEDDCESVVEVDEEKLREEEEAERLRLENVQKLNELMEKLAELEKKLKRPKAYDREFMFCVKAIEELSPTDPPLTKEAIKEFGLEPGSRPEQQKYYEHRLANKSNTNNKPPARNSSNGGYKPYGRMEKDYGFSRGQVTARNSIERAPKADLKNKAVNPWKAYKIKPEDTEKEEIRIEVVLKQVRSLLNKITPTYKEELILEFLKLNVSGPTPAFDAPEEQLSRVISVIFDKAVEEPRFCSLYAEICKRQVDFELRVNRMGSRFRNSILSRAQQSFVNKTMDEEKEAYDQETDEAKKKALKAKYDEDFVKFRRRKFGNINFIGQLYDQQLLSSKIIQWCFYDLLRATYPDKERNTLPEPPYDDESLQCATHLLEVVGKNFETAKDFTKAQEYLIQTVDHLMKIAPNCSPKIKFKILGVKELRDHRWKPRSVVEQGPKKISEIHKEVQNEKLQLENARDAYERKQSGAGFRQHSTSIPRRGEPVPSRGSQDARFTQMKRANAANTAMNTGTTSSPRNWSMSQGSDKKKWSSGASGGGAHDSPGSKQILQRGRGEKETTLSTVGNFMRDPSRIVIKQPVLSPEEQEKRNAEKLKFKETLKKLPSRIKSDLEEIESGAAKIEECTEELFKTPETNDLKKVFSCFAESCAQNISKASTLYLAGQVLRSCLQKNDAKPHVFSGFEDYCEKAVKESLSEDFPKLWSNLGVVIATVSQGETPPAALSQFEAVFKAAQDGKTHLLVATLKRLVEELPEGDEGQLASLQFEFGALCDNLKFAKLDSSLQGCNVDVVGYQNLFDVLKSQ